MRFLNNEEESLGVGSAVSAKSGYSEWGRHKQSFCTEQLHALRTRRSKRRRSSVEWSDEEVKRLTCRCFSLKVRRSCQRRELRISATIVDLLRKSRGSQ